MIFENQVMELLETMPKMKQNVYETYENEHKDIPFQLGFARFEWLEGFHVFLTKIYYKNGAVVYSGHTSQGYKISISNCDYNFFLEELKDWLNTFN